MNPGFHFGIVMNPGFHFGIVMSPGFHFGIVMSPGFHFGSRFYSTDTWVMARVMSSVGVIGCLRRVEGRQRMRVRVER